MCWLNDFRQCPVISKALGGQLIKMNERTRTVTLLMYFVIYSEHESFFRKLLRKEASNHFSQKTVSNITLYSYAHRNPQNCYDKHKMTQFRTYRRRKAKTETNYKWTGNPPPQPHPPKTEKQEDEETTPDINRTPIKEQRPQETAHTSSPIYT